VSLLSGPEIRAQIRAGAVLISDLDDRRIGANSVDLRLGPDLLVYAKNYPLHDYHSRASVSNESLPPLCVPLDMRVDEPVVPLTIPAAGLVLYPGVLYLGSTVEVTDCGPFVPAVEGRSSVGRLGLFVHVTAGFGDYGYRGKWTLELTPVLPVRVYAGTAVCQIALAPLVGEPQPYAGKYQNAARTQASRLWRDFQ
jgi:dCTP deaminase